VALAGKKVCCKQCGRIAVVPSAPVDDDEDIAAPAVLDEEGPLDDFDELEPALGVRNPQTGRSLPKATRAPTVESRGTGVRPSIPWKWFAIPVGCVAGLIGLSLLLPFFQKVRDAVPSI